MNDIEIYRKMVSVLESGENIALITVISTLGSTPGKVGYKMIVWGAAFDTLGTVGGGSVEAEIINKAKNILPNNENCVFTFRLKEEEGDVGALCGGIIEFLIETFDEKDKQLFREVLNAVENGEKGALISIISPGKPPEKIFLKNIEQIDAISSERFSKETIGTIKEIIEKERTTKKTLENGEEIFIEAVAEQPMVFIFGAGHLSYYISRYCKSLNFRVTVIDNREEYANEIRFPDADNIIVENIENIFDTIEINNKSYLIIVTRGHKLDEIVLERAVKTDAKYIGMIGSKRKVLTVFQRLAEEKGISEELLQKVYAPIGLSIGALTPEEIAFSIVSELIKIRRAGDAAEIDHMKKMLSI